jgi:hypothetical protein
MKVVMVRVAILGIALLQVTKQDLQDSRRDLVLV